MSMKKRVTVSGGFNDAADKKYPGLPALRMKLGMSREQFQDYVQGAIVTGCLAELMRREVAKQLRAEIARLRAEVAKLKREFAARAYGRRTR